MSGEDDYEVTYDDSELEVEEEEEDNYSESEDQSTSKKQKNKKRKRESKKIGKKKKKKRVSSDADDDDLESGVIQDDEEGIDSSTLTSDISGNNRQVEDEFDKIMEEARVTTSKGTVLRELRERLQKESDETSRNLIDRMKEAALKDEQILAEARGPAVHKLKMCDELRLACSKVVLQKTLISDGLLEVFALWLSHKGSSSDLPNLHIRTLILETLLELPIAIDQTDDESEESGITVEVLKSSQIGKFVKYLASHPNEIPSNKVKANQIIQKWTRLIHNLSDSYTTRGIIDTNDDYHRLRQPVEDVRRVTEQNDPLFSTRARVPRKTGFDFVKRPPKKDIIAKDSTSLSERQQMLQRKLNDLKRRSKK